MVRVCLDFFSKAANTDFFNQFPEASAWATTGGKIGEFFDHSLIFIDGWAHRLVNTNFGLNLMVRVFFSPFTREGMS